MGELSGCCLFGALFCFLDERALPNDKPGGEGGGNVSWSGVVENGVFFAVSAGGRGHDVTAGASDANALASWLAFLGSF